METFKKWFLFLLIAAMVPTVATSCSDDDDDGGASASEFVGVWQREGSNFQYMFASDGTGIYDYQYGYEEPFAWRVRGGVLDVDYDCGTWTDIEHHKYRFSNGGKTLELNYFAYTDGDEYEEDYDEDGWVTYHKVDTNADD